MLHSNNSTSLYRDIIFSLLTKCLGAVVYRPLG